MPILTDSFNHGHTLSNGQNVDCSSQVSSSSARLHASVLLKRWVSIGGGVPLPPRSSVGDGDPRLVSEATVDKEHSFSSDIVVIFVGVSMPFSSDIVVVFVGVSILLLKGVVKFSSIYPLFVCPPDTSAKPVSMSLDSSFSSLFIGEVSLLSARENFSWLCKFAGNGLLFCP